MSNTSLIVASQAVMEPMEPRLLLSAAPLLPAVNYPTGTTPFMVVSGDFNNDGNRDLATVNDSSSLDPGTMSILFGVGDGTFLPKTDIATDVDPDALVVGDFNNDGVDDLAVANYSGTVDVFLSNGDNTFQPKKSFATAVGSSPDYLAVGDFNNDGNTDLVVGLDSTEKVSVYLGNGSGDFALKTTLSVSGLTEIAVADLDGDGNSDLAIAQQGNATVRIVLGTGSGTFNNVGTGVTTFATGETPKGLAIGDFNNDNIPDLAVTSYNDENVGILLGVGNGTFQDQVTFPTDLDPHGVAVGDFDLDGNSDLAIANLGYHTATVLMGNGHGSFQAASPDVDVENAPRSVVVDDFNGDGRPDLAVANANSASVSVLLNTGPVVSDFARTVNEGATLKFTAKDFTGAFSDPAGLKLLQIKINSLPSHGTLNLSGVPVTAGQVIPASQLAKLAITLPVGFAGESQFGWQGYDGVSYSNYGEVNVWTTPKVSIVSNGNATEGGAGNSFTISLNVPALGDVTIPLSVSGKAKSGKNYTALPKKITISAGQTSVVVTLTPLVDGVATGDLSVIAKVGSGKGYIVSATKSATMTIVDDEPKISFVASPASTSFGGTNGTITFTRTGSTAAPLTFTITVKGTAKGGTDYTKLPLAITIPAHQISTTVDIVPLVNVTKTKTVIVSAKATKAFSLDPLGLSAIVSILHV